LKDTSDPHDESDDSSNGKLHRRDVHRVRENLENLLPCICRIKPCNNLLGTGVITLSK
jgi:hypothetical protein